MALGGASGHRRAADDAVPGSRRAVAELAGMQVLRQADRIRAYLATLPEEPDEWVQASTVTSSSFWATSEELRRLSEHLRRSPLSGSRAGRPTRPSAHPAPAAPACSPPPTPSRLARPATRPRGDAMSALAALRRRPAAWTHQPFRRLSAAWVTTNLGDSALYLMAAVWVKDLTGSDGAAGVVFAVLGASTLLAPAMGHLVDRASRRTLMVVGNLIGAALVSTLLLLTDTGCGCCTS